MLKQLFFTLALMGSLAALCSSTQAQKMARDGDSELSPHAADTIVKNFLAAQRSHEESTQEQGSAIADLNGDGKPEIVLVWTTSGPTYWHYTLTVFSQTSGGYKPVSSLPLNGEAQLSSAKDGVIVVKQTMYGKNDPLCCPTVKKQMEYQWSANKLSQLIAMPSVGSAAEMAGANSVPPLAVYGETVKVAPCSHGIPDSTFAWKDVKAYLPPGILQAPKAPMSHEQIVAALKELSKKSGVLLVDEINRFVPVYKEQHKDDKNDPFMELVDAFNSDHGGDALPGVNPDKIRATEKQDKEALALVCVQYAVQGLEPQ
jgi:hypothetical protein